jgi:hypothetical protein
MEAKLDAQIKEKAEEKAKAKVNVLSWTPKTRQLVKVEPCP